MEYMQLKPRESQKRALEKLENSRDKGKDSGLLVMATGTGKTVVSAMDSLEFGSERVLFLAHQKEIIQQAESEFKKVYGNGIETGFLYGDQKDFDSRFVFATVQTLSKENNLYEFNPRDFDYVIIDEFHHAQAPTYQKVISYIDPDFTLGLTATPYLVDVSKSEILEILDLEEPTFEYDIDDATSSGDLVEFEAYVFKDEIDWDEAPENMSEKDLNKRLFMPERDKKIIEKWKEKSSGRKTIAFCSSIEHADRVAGHFREQGVNAHAIHDQITDARRDKRVSDFRSGDIDVITAVDIFNEGVDFPEVETLVFLRPTMSRRVFKQQLGRGLRTAPEKSKCMVLDFVHKRSWQRLEWYAGESVTEYETGECDNCGQNSYHILETDGDRLCRDCRTDDVKIDTGSGDLNIDLEAVFQIADEYDNYKFNHKYSDRYLLKEMREVFQGEKNISVEKFDRKSSVNSRTVRERFDGWYNALKKAGLEVQGLHNYSPTDQEIKQDVVEYAESQEGSLSVVDYEQRGIVSKDVIRKRFGSWFDLLDSLGISERAIVKDWDRVEESDVLEDIRNVSDGNVISASRYRKEGNYSMSSIRSKFDTWSNAVGKAGLSTRNNIDKQDILEDMRSVYEEKGKLTQRVYSRNGVWSSTTAHNKFGSWSEAKEKALEGIEDA